jgi:hypothetical protein
MDDPKFQSPEDLLRALGGYQRLIGEASATCQYASRWLTYNAHALHDPDEDSKRADDQQAMPSFLPFYIAELEGVAKDLREASMRLALLAQEDRPSTIGTGFAPVLKRLRLRP